MSMIFPGFVMSCLAMGRYLYQMSTNLILKPTLACSPADRLLCVSESQCVSSPRNPGGCPVQALKVPHYDY